MALVPVEYYPSREIPKRKGSRTFEGGVILNPGFNQVDADALKKIENDPVFKILKECDAVKIGSMPVEDSQPLKPPEAPTKTESTVKGAKKAE